MDMWMDVDTALAEVPVNLMPLIDDTDFKTVEDAIAYNASGMDLRWNFVTTAGAMTSTAVTPTTAGTYDWTHQGDGIYSIEIPASGGASINNDTEGFGWFSGKVTGVLPWRGPVIGFRAAALNDALIDSAWSTTRGLAGTALPNAAADAAGGLIISDAGGLDIDSKLANTNEVTAARMGALTDWIDGGRLDLLLDAVKAVTDLLPNAGALSDLATLVTRMGTPSDLGGGATLAGNLADIEAQTDDIGAAGAGLTALASAANLATVAGYLDTEIAAIKAKTDQFVFTVANQVDANALSGGGGLDAAGVRAAVGLASANLDTQLGAIDDLVDTEVAAIKTVVDAIQAKTDNLPSDPADASVIAAAHAAIQAVVDAILVDTGTDGVLVATAAKTGFRLSATGVGDILTTALTESYSADGAAPTLSQAIFAIQQMMQERAISTTTMTVKKLDGTTTAFTLTLDDAGSPTSITRAT